LESLASDVVYLPLSTL